MELDDYLKQFTEEKVDTCFSHGGFGMYGREGSWYYACCDKYAGDVYSADISWLPYKNSIEAHCEKCLREAGIDYEP